MPLRVLMLIHSLRRGGAERVCLELSAGIKRRGDIVEIVSWLDVDEYPESCYQDIKRHYLIPKSAYKWLRSIPVSSTHLRRVVEQFKPDVIEIHSPNVAWLAAWARLGIPCVQVLHGYGDITKYGSLKAFLIRMAARAAANLLSVKFVAVSKSMKPVAARYFGIDDAVLDDVPNGVDLVKFPFVSPRPARQPTIIMIGTLSPNKGQVMGVEAFRLVLETLPDATLILAGDGVDMPRLQALVRKYALADKVKLLGLRSDVADLLAASHVLWQLSESEAMPMVVLEAMSMGIPVIGFDVRGTRDAVLGKQTGYLVPYGDIRAVAATTTALLTHDEEWDRLAGNARQRAENCFSLDAMIDNHRVVLDAAARSKS